MPRSPLNRFAPSLTELRELDSALQSFSNGNGAATAASAAARYGNQRSHAAAASTEDLMDFMTLRGSGEQMVRMAMQLPPSPGAPADDAFARDAVPGPPLPVATPPRTANRVTQRSEEEEFVDLPDVGRMSRRRLRQLEAMLSGEDPPADFESSSQPTAQHPSSLSAGQRRSNPEANGRRMMRNVSELPVRRDLRRPTPVAPMVEVPGLPAPIEVPGLGPISQEQLHRLQAAMNGNVSIRGGQDLPDLSGLSDSELERLEAAIAGQPPAPTPHAVPAAARSPPWGLDVQRGLMWDEQYTDQPPGTACQASWKINEGAFGKLAAKSSVSADLECSICYMTMVPATAIALPCSAHSCPSFFSHRMHSAMAREKPELPALPYRA
eukprot:gnl/TRDRNA2_/TRDRNA2_172895_c2_seq2.p1 gnl/TRDRNA2_/TRDRNA2_172895_c2~~gnl/TRDRNA2_/TRDRNA2_172895_c2_seq2.p1  ORF type:complete len:381 (+),score=47.62 gnl/TRDRNA2_/TRDRNA2_172895_c2_seq2:77-1219(+)